MVLRISKDKTEQCQATIRTNNHDEYKCKGRKFDTKPDTINLATGSRKPGGLQNHNSSQKQRKVKRNHSTPLAAKESYSPSTSEFEAAALVGSEHKIPSPYQRKVNRNHSAPVTAKEYKKANNRNHREKANRGFQSTENECLPDPSCILSMDCEMVGVGFDGLDSMLARVTIVDWRNNVLLDQYVKPERPVVDYRTHVSGITAADLESKNTVEISTCRAKVLSILEGKILVGHGLKNDLSALKITHPWHLIRDTARFELFMKVRFDDGVLWPRKLKELCLEYLNTEIQPIGQPHSSAEDAIAALQLYKFVQSKWESLVQYKVMKTAFILDQQQKKQQKQQQQQQQQQFQPKLPFR